MGVLSGKGSGSEPVSAAAPVTTKPEQRAKLKRLRDAKAREVQGKAPGTRLARSEKKKSNALAAALKRGASRSNA